MQATQDISRTSRGTRYVIYGAGAIGTTIATRLAVAGKDVRVIARGAQLEAIRREGLRLQGPDEEVTQRVPICDGPQEITDDDIVLMTMKSQDTRQALEAMAAIASPAVVCAQNGVENERLALRYFERVYGMLVYCPTQLVEAGAVQVFCAPVGGVLDVGRFPFGIDDTADTIVADLAEAGFAATTSERIMGFKYSKLEANVVNAVDIVLGPAHRDGQVAEQARVEARAVFAAAGVDVASRDEVSRRTQLMSPLRPVNGASPAGSSTWQSVVRGAGSVETDYLNGEIVLLGRLHGVPTPVNAALQRLAHRVITEGLEPGTFNVADIYGRTG